MFLFWGLRYYRTHARKTLKPNGTAKYTYISMEYVEETILFQRKIPCLFVPTFFLVISYH